MHLHLSQPGAVELPPFQLEALDLLLSEPGAEELPQSFVSGSESDHLGPILPRQVLYFGKGRILRQPQSYQRCVKHGLSLIQSRKHRSPQNSTLIWPWSCVMLRYIEPLGSLRHSLEPSCLSPSLTPSSSLNLGRSASAGAPCFCLGALLLLGRPVSAGMPCFCWMAQPLLGRPASNGTL